MPRSGHSGHGASRPPLVADRVRRIDQGGFAFIPNRFLHDGFFASLTPNERSLYLLLVLAGDRSGISFYHYDRLCSILEFSLEDFIEARNGLIDKDLIASDGTRIQVLSLPSLPATSSAKPLKTNADLERADGATIRAAIRRALDDET